MSTRPALGMIYILRGLRDLGEDITPVLDRYGIDLERLDPAARVDRALELRIYMEIADRLKDPLSGLRTGTFFGFTGYGPLTMLLMTCNDAYEAIQAGIRYQQLTYLFGDLRFEPGQQVSTLVLTPLRLPEKPFRFRVDGEASGTFKLVKDMQAALGLDLRAERIELPYPRPAEARVYEEHFQCPVVFGESAETRFRIRNEHLQIRFPTADPTAHALFRAQCEQQLAEQEATVPEKLSEKVAAHLELFTGGFPAAAEVASAFDISERSFRRQLSAEGSSFRAVLDGVRYRKAQQLLQGSRQSVEAIARELGYAEAAAFIHAFQRWAGCSPAVFRASARS
ncbi:MAG: AraC family transcriptional regulator [Moraxellaceae bacterium]|jgi:AraC-like DNA-binding protein|nr:AraC family transcriptional regulator [Moraxellaceae bacterium]